MLGVKSPAWPWLPWSHGGLRDSQREMRINLSGNQQPQWEIEAGNPLHATPPSVARLTGGDLPSKKGAL